MAKILRNIFGALFFFVAVFGAGDSRLLSQNVTGELLASQAQQNTDSAPTFDVVSIHPDTKLGKFTPPNFDLTPGDHWSHNGNLFIADLPLTAYIGFAYNLWFSPQQLEAMVAHQPAWISHDNMAIATQASGEPTKDQVRLMMRSMLSDRFKLVVHFEPVIQPVFELRLRQPGKLGPNLREDEFPCDALRPGTGQRTDADFQSLLPSDCGLYRVFPMTNHMRLLSARKITMPLIASFLSAYAKVDIPIVDQTGLPGTYDFALQWGAQDLAPPTEDGPNPGPTFSDSIEQQLGLRLIRSKVPLSTLVIDHVQLPSAN